LSVRAIRFGEKDGGRGDVLGLVSVVLADPELVHSDRAAMDADLDVFEEGPVGVPLGLVDGLHEHAQPHRALPTSLVA